jgi:hypothetical protein
MRERAAGTSIKKMGNRCDAGCPLKRRSTDGPTLLHDATPTDEAESRQARAH